MVAAAELAEDVAAQELAVEVVGEVDEVETDSPIRDNPEDADTVAEARYESAGELYRCSLARFVVERPRRGASAGEDK